MAFMLAATLTSLVITIINKAKGLAEGTVEGAMWGHWFQLVFAIAMVVMALILVKEGFEKFHEQRKMQKSKAVEIEE